MGGGGGGEGDEGAGRAVPISAEAAAQQCPHHLTSVQLRYEVTRILRQTLFGSVMLARSLDRHRVAVAIKTSSVAQFMQANAQGRAENPAEEAHVMRALTLARGGRGHTRVVRLLETAQYQNNFSTVLELCPGGELFDMVAQRGRLADALAARLARHCVRALRFMHAQGWAHLDVKPENILLDSTNPAALGAKLCDFGVARLIPGDGSPFAPARHRPGTLAYMAPEVYALQPYDRRADVYSLGAAFFVAAVGSPPYERPDPVDRRFQMIIGGRLGELITRWNLRGHVSDLAVDAIQRMMLPADQRITLDELLAHPWLAQVREPELEALEDAELAARAP